MLICKKPKIYDVDLYGLAAVIVILCGGWLGLLEPLAAKLQGVRQQQEACVQEKDVSRGELVRLQEVARENEILAVKLSRTRQVLESYESMDQVVRELNELADVHGMNLEEIKPGWSKERGRYCSQYLQLRLRGPFPSLGQMMDSIRRQLPYIRIANCQVERQTEQIDTEQVASISECAIVMELDIFTREDYE